MSDNTLLETETAGRAKTTAAGTTGRDNTPPYSTTKPSGVSSASLGRIGDDKEPDPRQVEVSKSELQSFMDAHPGLSQDEAIRAILATPLADRILDYYKLGWSIFPLLRHGKKPVVTWKKKGYQEKAPIEGQVLSWQKTHDKCNLAVATGAVSGIFVMDVDSPEGQAEAEQLGLPKTVVAKTTRGRHYYFKHPGWEVKNKTKIVDGVDVKGDRGMVTLPPSIHYESGLPYTWEVSPFGNPIADAPQWILDLIVEEETQPEKSAPIPEPPTPTNGRDAYTEAAVNNILLELSTAPEGTRNDKLNWASMRMGQFVAAGRLDRAKAEDQLRIIACAIGLDQNEIEDTIQSGLAYGMTQPEYEGMPPPVSQVATTTLKEPEPAETKTLSLTDLMKGPTQIDWLIEPIIPPGAAGHIVGDGGAGKTWLTLDLALATATGKKWAGHFQCRQGPVLMVDEENAELLLRGRLEKLMTARGIKDPGLIPLYFRVGTGINLSPEKNGNFSASFIELLAEVKRLGAILVIFDSLSRVHRSNENLSHEMASVFAHVKYLMDQTNAACIFNHHVNKTITTKSGARIRGSTDIRNFADFTLLVDKSDNGIKISPDKSRWAEPIDPFEVVLNYNALDDSMAIAYQGSASSQSEYKDIWLWVKELLGTEELSRQTMIAMAEEENVCKESKLDKILRFRFKNKHIEKRLEGREVYFRLPGTLP